MANIDISLPTINDDSDMGKVKDYLFQLTEQLRYVLNNLDEDNMTVTYNMSNASVRTIAEIARSMADNNSVRQTEDKNQIYEKIANMAQEIQQTFNTAIQENSDNIRLMVEENYFAKADQAVMERDLTSRIEMNSTSITAAVKDVTNLDGRLDGVESDLSKYQKDVESYMRFDEDGLELGRSDSEFKAKLSNVKLAFVQGTVEVAYISNNQLYITDAVIRNSLRVGHFVWEPRKNGNLRMVWRDD